MKFIIENIPKELKSKNQWVCYRIKKKEIRLTNIC